MSADRPTRSLDVEAISIELLRVLGALHMSMRRDNAERLASGTLTWAQHAVLAVLVESGPVRIGDLAAAVSLRPASTTIITSRLERQGFLRRLREPADKRLVIVMATTTGVQTYRSSVQRTRSRLESRLRELNRDDLSRIKKAVPVLLTLSEQPAGR